MDGWHRALIIDRYIIAEIARPFGLGVVTLLVIFTGYSTAVRLADAAQELMQVSSVVKLISLNTDHFQIYYPISKHVVSYAYRQLMLVTENPEGISAVGPDISPVFPVVIEVPRPFFHKS